MGVRFDSAPGVFGKADIMQRVISNYNIRRRYQCTVLDTKESIRKDVVKKDNRKESHYVSVEN